MKRKINFNKHAGVKDFVDFKAIYNAVENALESLDGGAEFKINNNYSVIWNDGSSNGMYEDRYVGLIYWQIDLYKNSKYEKSYCLAHYFNLYVELFKGNRDIVSDIALSISNDINIKKD
jgi:hypothetical protein